MESTLTLASTWLASAFMFYLFLRVGEVTTPTQAFNPYMHACREDIKFVHTTDGTAISHVVFNVKVQKSKQFRRGFDLILWPTDGPDCPVLLLQRLFLLQPRSPTSPLFDFRSPTTRSAPTHCSRTSLTKCVNECLLFQGIDVTTIKMHSFRQGAASAALAAGIPTWMLEQLGRWKSTAWKRYAFLAIEDGRTVAKAMANIKHNPGVSQGRFIAM
eukprot:m.118561 g.118561  ORF g.118561 m.118561 type:complete len:215 (-) comp28674_c0_seq3:580-1224(-)